jgi:transcription initiation factor TFIIB
MSSNNKIDNDKIRNMESNSSTDTLIYVCDNCQSTEVIYDVTRGQRVCSNCGYVIEDRIVDHGAEWRAYNSAESNERSRVGLPASSTLHDRGLSTIIGYENQDVYGKRLTANQRSKIYRMRKWQLRSRISESQDRSLAKAFTELDRLAAQLALPRSIVETAALMFRKASEQRIIRGHSIESIIAACIYAASRIRHFPRTLQEIADETAMNKKELAKNYRYIVTRLKLNIPLANPEDYIVRFATELNLSAMVQRKAIELLKEAKANGLTTGKDPTGLAAATLYLASIMYSEKRTQREIAEIANVTEVTIRSRYKDFIKSMDINYA